jgi:hypothetical protein
VISVATPLCLDLPQVGSATTTHELGAIKNDCIFRPLTSERFVRFVVVEGKCPASGLGRRAFREGSRRACDLTSTYCRRVTADVLLVPATSSIQFVLVDESSAQPRILEEGKLTAYPLTRPSPKYYAMTVATCTNVLTTSQRPR